ncbi:MAG: hypothetical protein HY869_06335 [Chloroflexi bacterium]|nr:hypothetical protein [Chloroflexota bacterium]
MRNLTRILFVVTVLFVLIVTGFNVIGRKSKAQSTENCMPLDVNFAFPVGLADSRSIETPISPPQQGKVIFSLPENVHTYAGSSLVYYKKGLWIYAYTKDVDGTNHAVILRYSLDNQSSKKYLAASSIELNTFGFGILLTSQEGLWFLALHPLRDAHSFLLRYDEDADLFESVPYNGGYFESQVERIRKETYGYQITGYATAQNGHIWFTDIYNLYEFNPSTSIVESRLRADDGSIFRDPVVDADGFVWLLDEGKGHILKFHPDSQHSESFVNKLSDGFTQEDLRNNTLLDRDGRLWISDTGWIDTRANDAFGNPLWYRVVRSPVFISRHVREYNEYAWEHPVILKQTSDGSIWFRTSYALVRLDINTWNWCKVSYGGNIEEDGAGRIWILYRDKIYQIQDIQ